MAISLPKETMEPIVASVRRWFHEQRDEDPGELGTKLLVDFFLEEVGPAVYNQAIRDAARYLQERALDMDGVLYEEELPHWKR